MLHKADVALITRLFFEKKEQNSEAGKAMSFDIESRKEANAHWKNVEAKQEEIDERLKELGKEDGVVAWIVRSMLEVAPILSISQFLKCLEVCGIEVTE